MQQMKQQEKGGGAKNQLITGPFRTWEIVVQKWETTGRFQQRTSGIRIMSSEHCSGCRGEKSKSGSGT